MTPMRALITATAAVSIVVTASCGSPRSTLVVRDQPISTSSPPSSISPDSNAGSPAPSTSTSTSTTSTTAERRSGSSGSPLPSPERSGRTQIAPTQTSALSDAPQGVGEHVGSDSSAAEGWRTLDGSCTVTDTGSAAEFGFTPDPDCMPSP